MTSASPPFCRYRSLVADGALEDGAVPADCTGCACNKLCLVGKMEPQVRARWQFWVTERSFAKGTPLLRQGETLTVFRIVKVGTIMLLRSSEYGAERPVGLCGHGQTLGSTMLLGQPAVVSCVAISPVRICELPITPLLDTGLIDHPFLWTLAVAYAQTNAHIADWARVVRTPGVAGQVAGTLLQLAALQQTTLVRLPSQTALAALLATSRETIARTLRQLELENCLVRHDRWHCEIRRDLLLARCGDGQMP